MKSEAGRKERHLYRDPDQPVDVRVMDLLSRMTVEEKVRETGFLDGRNLMKGEKHSTALMEKHLGRMSIGGILAWVPAPATAPMVNAVQRYLINETRLGIPALIMSDSLHGCLSSGATTFPQAIGLSCSWEPGLLEEVAATGAREASSMGIRQVFSPDLDLGRDPRWGRVEETYGEDTYLCSRLGVAYVRGLQGCKSKLGPERLVATLRHFAGHCDPQGGINGGPADLGERKLRQEYLAPFKAAVDAGALSVVTAYNEIDGVPCAASKLLMRQILREEWGFKGFTFADFGAIEFLATYHKTAADLQEAGKQSFEAGMDMEAPGIKCFGEKLLQLIKKGEVTTERLEEAAGNILRVKFLAGLFERPFVDEGRAKDIVHCGKHVQLARQVAGESIVLLKNEDEILPLDRNKISSLAVIGPNADVAECGDYCIPKSENVSPLEGIQAAVAPGVKVNFASGCDLHALSKNRFDEAVQAACNSDVAVVFVGGSSMSLGGVGWVVDGRPTRPSTCGEGYDRTDLGLPGVQQELVEAVAATGTPVVVVLINGRPLSVSWIAENIPAILEAWYPGEQGGHAIADILFGEVNPSAKLTMSIPRSVGQVPVYYSRKPTAYGYYRQRGAPGKPGRDYVYSEVSPLYDFGFGLSYTEFRYSNLRVSPSRIAPEATVKVSVDVRNIGSRPGKEVVQLYINDVVSSVTTPAKILKGFKKTDLRPGQVKTITFELGPDELSLVNEDMELVVEPGVFEVMIGSLEKSFEVRKR